jgi:hypothetical protein
MLGSTSLSPVTTISTTTVTSSLTSSLTAPTTSLSGVQTTKDQVETQNNTGTSQLTNFPSNGTEQTRDLEALRPVGTNTLFIHTERRPQSGVTSGSSGTANDSTFAMPKYTVKSGTVLFGGTFNAPAVSSSASSLSSASTSTKAKATQSFTVQSLLGSSSTPPQPTSKTLPGICFQTTSTGDSTGNITQTTARPVTQNTTVGLFNTGTSSSNVGGNIKTSNFTTTTSSQPNTVGFSFSAPLVARENPTSHFTAPAVTAANVSGGFTFTAQATEKKTPQSGFSFAAPTANKSTTSGTFSFNAPTAQKSSTSSGFASSVSTANKSSTSGTFSFTAPTTNKPNTSGGFSFTAPANDKAGSSGGFQFNAPAVNNNSGTFSSTNGSTTLTNNPGGGFSFNAGSKTPANSAGFNFGSQNTPATFNFGKLKKCRPFLQIRENKNRS